MNLAPLVVMLLVSPLAFTLLMALLPKTTARSTYAGLHMASMAVVLILSLVCALPALVTGNAVDALGPWLHLDALGSVFVLLIGIIGFMTGIYSLPYVRHDVESGIMDESRVKQYYALFSLFVFTMLLAAVSNNLILTWAAIEATTLSTVFLVGIYRTRESLEASWKYAMVCTAGVAFGLFGTLLIYANAADIMTDPHGAAFFTQVLPYADKLDPMLVKISFVFVLIGFGTKAGLFPMHTWLPDAHSHAPSPVSGLLSGVLLKCAILVIIRFYIVTTGAVGTLFPSVLLLVVGLLSVVTSAFALVAQNDIKRMFAYSSVENVGIIAVALGFGGPIGIAAALLHCVFHGLTKALLFCMSGNLMMRYGTRDLRKIIGVIEVMPVTAVVMIIGLFSLVGFPPLAMFISEFMMFVSGVEAHMVWAVVLVALALTLVIAVIVKMVTGSVMGHAPEGMKKGEVSPLALVPEVALLACIVWFGVAMPQPLAQGVSNSCDIVLQNSDSAARLQDTPLFGGLLFNAPDAPSQN